MIFLHLSDLHFHRNNENNEKALNTLNYINENYPDANLIVTGDISDDGDEKQYKNAFDALKPFKDRLFICPGNHDFGAAGNLYNLEIAKRFDDMLSVPLEQGGTFVGNNKPVVNVKSDGKDTVMLIALDSNLETEHFFDFACGEIGRTQLRALDTLLSNPTTAKMTKILFLHHHPFIHNNPFMELKDAPDLARVIYQRVDVLCFGHKHVMNLWEKMLGIEYVLASDNSPGKSIVRSIIIKGGEVKVKDAKIA